MGLDSVELVMDVEDWFSIDLPDEDFEGEYEFTVGWLSDLVLSKPTARIRIRDASIGDLTRSTNIHIDLGLD